MIENLTRTRRLCQQLGDSSALFDALCGLCFAYSNGGDVREAERIGEELSPLSEQLDPSAVVQTSFLRGGSPCGPATWMPRNPSWPRRFRRR